MEQKRLKRIIDDAKRQVEIFGRIVVPTQTELLEAAENYLSLLDSLQETKTNFAETEEDSFPAE